MKPIALVLAVLCITPAVGQAPDAQAIWDKVVETYTDAESFQADGSIDVGFGFFDMNGRASWAYRKPNKFMMTHSMSGSMGDWGSRTVMSNGISTYERIEATNEYTMKPAPKTFAEFITRVESMTNMGLVSVGQLLAGVDTSDRIESVAYVRSGRYYGTPVHVLDLKLSLEQPAEADAPMPTDTQRVWIGRSDSLIYKSQLAIDMRGMVEEMMREIEAMEDLEPATDGEETTDDATEEDIDFEAMVREIVEGMTQMFGDGKLGITERYRNIRLNEELPPGTFNFHIRPGEKRVDRLTALETLGDEPPDDFFTDSDIPDPGSDDPDIGTPQPSALVGTQAPDFTLTDLDGNDVTLSELRGDPILLDFWASWCGPCLQELPHIQELHEEYADRGLRILGVSVDDSSDDAAGAADEMGLAFTILWSDAVQPIAESYAVSAIPTLILIDSDGVIADHVIGYHDKAALVEMLKKVGL